MLTLYDLKGRDLRELADDEIDATLRNIAGALASVNALYGKRTGTTDARTELCDEIEKWRNELLDVRDERRRLQAK